MISGPPRCELTAGELDGRVLDAYSGLVDAATETAVAYQAAWDREGDALVPMAVVTQGIALKERMFKVLDYHCSDVESVRTQLESIRAGTGYRDLATDLGSLAQLQTEHREAIATDTKYYRATDVADAQACANGIQAARSGGAPVQKAAKPWARAFAAVRAAHDEIVAVGRYLERKSGDPNAQYPSLFAAVKKTSTPKKKKGEKKDGEKP